MALESLINSSRQVAARARRGWLKPRVPRAVTALMVGDRCIAVRVAVGSRGLQIDAVAECAPAELRQWRDLLRGSTGVLVARPEERQLLAMDRPDVPDAELPRAVRWPLAEALEAEPEQLLSTVLALPGINDAQRPQILAVATRIHSMRAHFEALRGTGLKVQAIDIADSALRGMALLQPPDNDGWVAAAISGTTILIGLLWHSEFCVLRSLPLPPRSQSRDTEFEQYLALQIQRTVDHFGRQATQLTVRHVLLALPSLPSASRAALQSALPLGPRIFDIADHVHMDAATLARWGHDEQVTVLAGVAIARIVDAGLFDHVAQGRVPVQAARTPSSHEATAAALLDAASAGASSSLAPQGLPEAME